MVYTCLDCRNKFNIPFNAENRSRKLVCPKCKSSKISWQQPKKEAAPAPKPGTRRGCCGGKR